MKTFQLHQLSFDDLILDKNAQNDVTLITRVKLPINDRSFQVYYSCSFDLCMQILKLSKENVQEMMDTIVDYLYHDKSKEPLILHFNEFFHHPLQLKDVTISLYQPNGEFLHEEIQNIYCIDSVQP